MFSNNYFQILWSRAFIQLRNIYCWNAHLVQKSWYSWCYSVRIFFILFKKKDMQILISVLVVLPNSLNTLLVNLCNKSVFIKQLLIKTSVVLNHTYEWTNIHNIMASVFVLFFFEYTHCISVNICIIFLKYTQCNSVNIYIFLKVFL